MAWTADFIAKISAPTIRPIYVLESVPITSDRDRIGGTLNVASKIVPGHMPVLVPEGSRVSYGALRPGDWSVTQSEWELGLTNQNLAEMDIRQRTARGQLVALKIGFPGWGASRFQPVAHGVVQDVTHSGHKWTIRLRSLLGALTTRPTFTMGEQALFHKVATTTLSANYTAGNATVSVVSNAAAERETGGKYAIRITPNTGDPFVVTATGTGVNTFTGCSAAAILGGTVANASSGKNVEILAYVQDHPLEVARKILTSTGAATNGAFDTLPASYGLGLDESLIDDGDCRSYVTLHAPNGISPAPWDVFSATSQADPLAWLASVLAPMGGFITERQGLLTIRAATTSFQRPLPERVWDIYDADIVEIDSYSAYDSSQPVEYSRVRAVDSHAANTDLGTADGEEGSTMPILGTKRLDLDYVETNRPDWRQHVLDAIGPYYTRVCETVSVTCRGWRMAQAAPGDHVHIHTNSAYLSGRRRGTGGSDLSTGAAVLLTSVEPDWFGATCRLTGVRLSDIPNEQ